MLFYGPNQNRLDRTSFTKIQTDRPDHTVIAKSDTTLLPMDLVLLLLL